MIAKDNVTIGIEWPFFLLPPNVNLSDVSAYLLTRDDESERDDSPVLSLRRDAITSGQDMPTLRTSRASRGVDQKVRAATPAGTERFC